MSTADLEALFRTNVYGPVHAIQAALPHLRKTSGQVINVSSSLARATVPYSVGYCMTKHALHSLSVGLRMELRPQGIRVIEVAPGLTDTDFQKAARRVGNAQPLAAESRQGWPASRVARAILRASKRGTEEVWLTLDGGLLSFGQRHFPRASEWALRKWAEHLARAPQSPGR
jgi:NAD(P)-dependent dehydrogenase (short-subunit alcohol dehydrogenase family)